AGGPDRDRAVRVEAAATGLRLLHQESDEGRRAVVRVGAANQLDRAGEAFAQVRVMLLNEGRQIGGVERATQRRNKTTVDRQDAQTYPTGEQKEADRDGQAEPGVGEEGARAGQKQHQYDEADAADGPQSAEAAGHGRELITQARR